jgi:4-hydroxybenzoate polyprenyltransferase
MKPNESGLTRSLRLIRFSHTIFALPFALGALLVATRGRPSARLLTLVLVCMVSARTAAMLFNRLADWTLDQRNPRTAMRHQLVSRPVVVLLLIGSSVAFVVAAGFINRTSLLLSPLALAIISGHPDDIVLISLGIAPCCVKACQFVRPLHLYVFLTARLLDLTAS